jgi:hypothetical protein
MLSVIDKGRGGGDDQQRGLVIELMTKDVGFFGRWFTVCRDYREEGWKLMTLQLGTVAL